MARVLSGTPHRCVEPAGEVSLWEEFVSVQQDWAEDEPGFGSAPVPVVDPPTEPLNADIPRDPGPVTARATVPPVFDHPVRVVTGRAAARPPVPAQARPAPISA